MPLDVWSTYFRVENEPVPLTSLVSVALTSVKVPVPPPVAWSADVSWKPQTLFDPNVCVEARCTVSR